MVHKLYRTEVGQGNEEAQMIRNDLWKGLKDDLRQANNLNGLGTQGLSKILEVFIITRKF